MHSKLLLESWCWSLSFDTVVRHKRIQKHSGHNIKLSFLARTYFLLSLMNSRRGLEFEGFEPNQAATLSIFEYQGDFLECRHLKFQLRCCASIHRPGNILLLHWGRVTMTLRFKFLQVSQYPKLCHTFWLYTCLVRLPRTRNNFFSALLEDTGPLPPTLFDFSVDPQLSLPFIFESFLISKLFKFLCFRPISTCFLVVSTRDKVNKSSAPQALGGTCGPCNGRSGTGCEA